MLYLDNSATTSIIPEVLESMLPYLKEEYGNPSSKYYSLADNANKAVNIARKQAADLLGCDQGEVIFTSGATESNNMILKGIIDCYGDKNSHIVTTKVEHSSILETCKYLENKGCTVTYINVDQFGRIDSNDLINIILKNKPLLVSIIWGNNEIGSLNDIENISKICKENNIFFHTDATQVVGKIKLNLNNLSGINFLSCSAHKLHGPKGIGAVVIRKNKLGLKTKITPLLHGGEQENGYRSGTLAVHNIVGFGKAAEIAFNNIEKNTSKLKILEEILINILKKEFKDEIIFNNDWNNKIPGILSIQFKGIFNELFIKKFADKIAVSTGSACSSTKPSHVLQAIGKDINDIRSTIRISLSHLINEEEILNLKLF